MLPKVHLALTRLFGTFKYMHDSIKKEPAESLRLANHAIIDAQGHLKAKDIDRAVTRLSDAKILIGQTIEQTADKNEHAQ